MLLDECIALDRAGHMLLSSCQSSAEIVALTTEFRQFVCYKAIFDLTAQL